MARKPKEEVEKKEEKKNTKKSDSFSLSQVITIAVITLIFSFVAGLCVCHLYSTEKNPYSDDIVQFIEEYQNVKDTYYKDLDDKDSMKIALEAIINSLDNYSAVVDDNLSNTLTTKLQGEYQGFGIEVANDVNMNIVVVRVIKDSPAEAANMQVLDIIKSVDGKSVQGLTTTEFVELIKKANKSTYAFEVERDGSIVNLEMTRELVTLNSVASQIYERNGKKIGYIYVSVFAYNTDVQFKKALDELEGKGIDSLIVDLRYNTGGHLTAVENMMSYFLDKSHVIYQIQTKKDTTKYYSKGSVTKKYPMVVLVNENSASASELFTATMQEEYGATIMGVTTFGKGTVQEVLDSSNISDEYKITTSKWLTPKGNWINEVGVKPDIEVKLDVKDVSSFTDDEDNQLQDAINYLAK